jgi:hypothetical protein
MFDVHWVQRKNTGFQGSPRKHAGSSTREGQKKEKEYKKSGFAFHSTLDVRCSVFIGFIAFIGFIGFIEFVGFEDKGLMLDTGCLIAVKR